MFLSLQVSPVNQCFLSRQILQDLTLLVSTPDGVRHQTSKTERRLLSVERLNVEATLDTLYLKAYLTWVGGGGSGGR